MVESKFHIQLLLTTVKNYKYKREIERDREREREI
jgi:hypothetical protein